MKQCIHCGRALPDEASFCPYCETEQTPPKPADLPKKWRKKAVTALALVCVLAFAGFIGHSLKKPKILDNGGAETVYRGYHVLVRLTGLPEDTVEGQPEYERTMRPNTGFAMPARLFVFKENDTVNAAEEFMELADRVSLTAESRDGANPMEVRGPAYAEAFPDAALAADVLYDTECGTNDLIWTISMKNGDRIVLRQAFTVHELQVISLYPQDAPMETIEELQALLDRLVAEVDPGTMINLYLPAVVYDGGISFKDRTVTLYGSSDGSVNTTFTGPVTVESIQPFTMEIFGVNFAGNGEGTGLQASRGMVCYDCVFSNWKTGALAANGSWISTHNCIFENNDIGYQLNSHESSVKSPDFDGTQFLGNGIGLHLVHVPDDIPLAMNGCVFEGNGTDVQNESGVSVDLSQAEMR